MAVKKAVKKPTKKKAPPMMMSKGEMAQMMFEKMKPIKG
jgi:hypothetical protein